MAAFFAFKGSGHDAASGSYFALVDARADAGGKPSVGFAKLHVGFGERDTFDAAHFGVGIEQQRELRFQRNLERVFAKGALPTVNVGLLVGHHHVVALRGGGSFGNGDSLNRATLDAFTGEAIGGGEAPSTTGEHANSQADGFGLREGADFSVLGGEIALALVHDANVGVSCATEAGGFQRSGAEVPHIFFYR